MTDLIEELAEIIPWCQGTNELHARAIAEIARLKAEKINLLNWLNTHHPHVAIAWAREPK